MASFAKLGLNNKVIEVLSVHNNELLDSNGVEQEVNGIDFLTKLTGYPVWKQTSYNHNIRKNHSAIGDTYDEVKDAFIAPQPYPSWKLNKDTCRWEAPIAYPSDGKLYDWNESTTNWKEAE